VTSTLIITLGIVALIYGVPGCLRMWTREMRNPAKMHLAVICFAIILFCVLTRSFD